MADYRQGEIVWADYPLSDKPEKSKIWPVLIVSNSESNQLDNDLLIAPITSRLRGQPFEVILTNDKVSAPLPLISAIRCNKLHTIRNTRIIGKIAQLTPETLTEIVSTIQRSIRVLQA